jgi:hypothetical protein
VRGNLVSKVTNSITLYLRGFGVPGEPPRSVHDLRWRMRGLSETSGMKLFVFHTVLANDIRGSQPRPHHHGRGIRIRGGAIHNAPNHPDQTANRDKGAFCITRSWPTLECREEGFRAFARLQLPQKLFCKDAITPRIDSSAVEIHKPTILCVDVPVGRRGRFLAPRRVRGPRAREPAPSHVAPR